MRMLEEGQDADVQITWKDQQNINTFSKLNSKLSELEEDVELQTKHLEYLDDAVNELDLILDEDEKIPYNIGDVFIMASAEECRTLLKQKISSKRSDFANTQTQVAAINSEMEELKVLLHAKLGDSIRLEE